MLGSFFFGRGRIVDEILFQEVDWKEKDYVSNLSIDYVGIENKFIYAH